MLRSLQTGVYRGEQVQMVPSVQCPAEGSSLNTLPKNGEKLTLSLGSC